MKNTNINEAYSEMCNPKTFEQGFNKIYNATYDILLRHASLSFPGNLEQCEDIVQDTFLKFIDNVQSGIYKHEGFIIAYLKKIVWYKCNDFHKVNKKLTNSDDNNGIITEEEKDENDIFQSNIVDEVDFNFSTNVDLTDEKESYEIEEIEDFIRNHKLISQYSIYVNEQVPEIIIQMFNHVGDKCAEVFILNTALGIKLEDYAKQKDISFGGARNISSDCNKKLKEFQRINGIKI